MKSFLFTSYFTFQVLYKICTALPDDPERTTVPMERDLSKNVIYATFPHDMTIFSIIRESAGQDINQELKEYLDHNENKTIAMLNYFEKKLINMCPAAKNMTVLKEEIINNFQIKLQQDLNYTVNLKKLYDINDEFLFLNILETTYEFLSEGLKNMLSRADEGVDRVTNLTENIKNIRYSMNIQLKEFRQEELLHLCNVNRVCKPYPALTDYIKDLINIIEDFPENKKSMLARVLSNTIMNDENYILMIDTHSHMKIYPEVEKVLSNVPLLKRGFRALKAILDEKFKVKESPNDITKVMVQAVRKLLDITDEAFRKHKGLDDVFHVDWVNTLEGLKRWGKNEKQYVVPDVTRLISHVLEAMYVSKYEMKGVLLKIIINGRPNNVELYNNLFRNGFMGVYKKTNKGI